MSSRRATGSVSAIPHYFLYGESTRDVDQQFLHIETIDSRSRKHAWSIKPHVHPELHHLLFVEQGSGRFDIDAEGMDITAPMIINVPAHTVHGFQFAPETAGWIITSSNALLQRISRIHPEFDLLLCCPAVMPLETTQAGLFTGNFAMLAQEFLNEQVARRAAVEGRFLSILVDVIRIKRITDAPVAIHHDTDAALVSRYKNLIEKHFHERVGATEYATRLCVCHERLRSACVRITGTSPLALLNARRLLEAKRCLLYTSLTIAEVAYQSGFEDPAYFSRFFARSTSKSPRDYRTAHIR